MITTIGMPRNLMDRIQEFLQAGHSGNVQLDIKDGRILSWKVTEYGKVHTSQVDNEEMKNVR